MNFLNLFPLPKFLKIPVVGFDISDKSIKYIQFDGEKIIKQFGEKKLPSGIIESGEIKKEDELVSFLRENFKNSNIENVIVSLPEEKAFLDIIELPKMRPENIRKSLEVQLENYFPIKSSEAVFDYKILNFGGANPDALKFFDVLVSVFPRLLIGAYQNVWMKAGIKPLAFQPEAEALKRSLCKENNVPKMLVDFGKTRTTFIIAARNSVLFTSTVKISGKDLDEIIRRSLSVSGEEAEKIKIEKGRILPAIGKESAQNQKIEEREIQSILTPVISALRQEIDKYIAYWQTHYGHIHEKGQKMDIKEIILCGGDANLAGLTEYLTLTLKIPVKLANVWLNVFSFEEYVPEIEFNKSLKFATAVGLALKGKELGL